MESYEQADASNASEKHVPKITLLSLAKHLKERHVDKFKEFPEVVVSSPFITIEA